MIVTSLVLALGAAFSVSAQSTPEFPPANIYRNPLQAKCLIYSFTEGFRHDSIPTAVKQLQAWGPYHNISFDATEDQSKINAANLAQYDAIVFVHTTGNIFSTAGQAGFVDYLSKGGNIVGVHAASVAYMPKVWKPWTDSLGSTFDHHPKRQNATFTKQMSHPSTDVAPERWNFEEEVYSFVTDPRKLGAKVLYSVDASSYKDSGTPPGQGDPHPISWYQDYAAGAVITPGSPGPGVAGRSWYSSLGHLNQTWQNPTFMQHVMAGITWTFGSNTTRVAAGLYGGEEPTVHTGATNSNSATAPKPWSPVLGSNATAPAPPASMDPPSPSAAPPSASATAGGGSGSSSNTSGATSVRIGSGVWAIALAVVGAFAL